MRRTHTVGSLWVGILVVSLYAVAVLVFAYQTWQLVATIFPSDNTFMQIATVASFDVMSLLFALADMVWPFRSRAARGLCVGMWLVTFTGSLLCSIIYMYLSSLHLLGGVLNPSVLV